MPLILPGVHQAPNIQTSSEIYEIENIAADPQQKIEAAMWSIYPWADKILLDLGAGTGFHISRFHDQAAHVFAMVPHDESRLKTMSRIASSGMSRLSVMTGSAEQIMLPDSSVDMIHARFAYFFGSKNEAGLTELARVLRPGGIAFIIDNDLRNGLFAQWLKRHPNYSQISVSLIEEFWQTHGFQVQRIPSEWRFASRADFEAVAQLEFGQQLATQLLSEHNQLEVEYHYCLYYRQF